MKIKTKFNYKDLKIGTKILVLEKSNCCVINPFPKIREVYITNKILTYDLIKKVIVNDLGFEANYDIKDILGIIC